MRAVILFTLCLMPMAGCLGSPEGTVAVGDTVFAAMIVRDASSGEEILGETAVNFAVGNGESGYGFDFERAFLGREAGESFVVETDALEYSGQVLAPRFFGTDPTEPIPLAGELERERFVGAFGEPTDGMEFTPPLSFYSYRVLTSDELTVRYVALPEDGQENEVPHVGSTLVTHVEYGNPDDDSDDRMVQELKPIIDATFTVQPPSPFQPSTPLGLQPGSFKVIGSDEANLILAHNPTLFSELIGHELRFEIQLNSIQPGLGTSREPVDGNYGVRQSTQVNGHPESEPDFGPHGSAMQPSQADEQDDGHDGHS